ncbi:Ig-like domain-containing protein [Leifsonia shinshuensis]|uniref:Ig-like domain-containing protein n=1 Tax=Leifsonia shinshuensis TaxID=150026 RepID=UPI001F50B8C0|nr:Ig-like domain-containing protein [Leifsonia shinshuensis]MCI0155844.1 Ig-like domain-containing protein [Leifsonia shinshuensis]
MSNMSARPQVEEYGPSRRSLVAAAAWSLPAITLSVASPAYASSPPEAQLVVLSGAEVLDGPQDYTVTVTDQRGGAASGQRVILIAPDGTRFGDAATVTGLTDGAGRFTATLTPAPNAIAGDRELVATCGAATSTFTLYLPSESVSYAGSLGTTFTEPLNLLMQGGILPDRAATGLFQYRVMQELVTSNSNYWMVVKPETGQWYGTATWERLELGKWYTGGYGASLSGTASIAWGARSNTSGRNALDVALSPRVPIDTPLSLEFRRLTGAEQSIEVTGAMYRATRAGQSLRWSRVLAIV